MGKPGNRDEASYFSGKVALVTGAGSGIGAALCRSLVARGARVVAADIDITGVTALCESLGANATSNQLDVRDGLAFERLVKQTVALHKTLDLLFNIAGILGVGEVRDLGADNWRRIIETNLFGVINGTQVAYPIMLGQRFGHIVNMASQAGLLPSPLYAPYAASKAAVIALSNALRLEAKAFGVHVSVACPGNVATRIFDTSEVVNVGRSDVFKATPLGTLTASRAAEMILNGVARKRFFIVFPLSTRVMWLLYRISPGALDPLFREVLKRFREARIKKD